MRERADLAAAPDARAVANHDEWQDGGLGADLHVTLDDRRRRILYQHAVEQVTEQEPVLHDPAGVGELVEVIDPQYLVRIEGRHCFDVLTLGNEPPEHVGQVVFALGVV